MMFISHITTQLKHQVPLLISRSISSTLKSSWLQRLQQNNIEHPMVSIDEISKYIDNKNCSESIADSSSSFEELCMRRLNREPLQYIIGEWDFRYLTLKMKPPVFIPRPETEMMIDFIHNDIKTKKIVKDQPTFHVLEIGCGSGAISLSLLKEIQNISLVCMDILDEAVKLTKLNASLNNLDERLTVLHKDFSQLNDIEDISRGLFDVIVSNPPYIPTEQINTLQDEVKLHESVLALDGGKDGLDLIKVICQNVQYFLKPNGSLWLEVDDSHCNLIEEYVESNPKTNLKFIKHYHDHYKRPRFCHLVLRDR